MGSKWLCFRFNQSGRKQIISAFLQSECWKSVNAILISFKSSPNSEKYADAALQTTRSSLDSKVSRVSKHTFYKWQYNWIYNKLINSNVNYVACFNGLKGVDSLVVAASRELEIPVLFFESAPLSNRVQIDWKGVNFDSSIPRNIDFYRNLVGKEFEIDWQNRPPVARPSIKASSVKQVKDTKGKLSSQKYIFCPLQTPKDSQLTVHGGWIKDIHHFLNCISKLVSFIPNGLHLRIKEHPSSKVSLTNEILEIQNTKIVLDNDTDTMDLIANSQGVLTINSTVGLEAFYFGKPVITLGRAFYSFGELTSRAENFSELSELIQYFEQIHYSESDRDLFMRFLHYWYPTRESILKGKFTLKEFRDRTKRLSSEVQ